MCCADGRLVHARNNGRGPRTDSGRGVRVRVTDSFLGQLIEMRRAQLAISVGPKKRRDIFNRDPNNAGLRVRSMCSRHTQETHRLAGCNENRFHFHHQSPFSCGKAARNSVRRLRSSTDLESSEKNPLAKNGIAFVRKILLDWRVSHDTIFGRSRVFLAVFFLVIGGRLCKIHRVTYGERPCLRFLRRHVLFIRAFRLRLRPAISVLCISLRTRAM